MRKWRRMLVGAALAVAALLAVWLAAAPGGRAVVTTALLLPEVLPNAPARPLAWFTPPPLREEIAVSLPGGAAEEATLYRPGQPGRHSAIVLHLGVYPDPDDPTLHQLASGLARAGIVTLIPRSAALMQGRIEPEEVEAVVAAFQHLAGRDDVDPERIGLAGFSVGAALSALAAADPRIAGQAAFLNFFGGYYDARDLIIAVATRCICENGLNEPWQPDPLTRQVVVEQLTLAIENPEERARVRTGLLAEDAGLVRDARLSAAARTVVEVYRAPGRSAAEAALDRLPAAMLDRLRQVSPSSVTQGIRAPVSIMHDRNDAFIPFTQSRRLYQALGPERARFTEFSLFKHMHPQDGGDALTFAGELLKLFGHLHGVMTRLS